MKATIRQIFERDAGRVFFVNYTKRGEKRSFACVAIQPRDSVMRCDACGTSQWNASNLGNDIHFCPDWEIDVTFSDYKISTPTAETGVA